MIRAAAYCRYSSDNQRQESIEIQLAVIQKYANDNGMTIETVYSDEAQTATNDDRANFQRMILDSEFDLFDVVLVYKFDRFSRDKTDSVVYKKKLRDRGIKVISVVENIGDTQESVVWESMLEGMAEYYSRNLSREAGKGLASNASKGLTTGGKPPFGYNIENKQYVVNEKEAFAVAKVFHDYVNGVSYRVIAKWLNDNGYKTKQGTSFVNNSIHYILKNEKYAGVYRFKTSSRSKYTKGSQEDIVIEGGVPSIVSKEVFEKAQQMLTKNKHNSQSFKAKEYYVLSGKIYCGECDSKMFGNRRKSHDNYWSGYKCAGVKKKICKAKEINKQKIEAIILNHLEKEVFNDEFLDALAEEIFEYHESRGDTRAVEIENLKKRYKDVIKQIDNAVEAVMNGFASEALKIKMQELEFTKLDIAGQIAVIEKRKAQSLTYKEIRDYLNLGKGIAKKPVHEQVLIVNTFIDRVVVYPENIEVHFSFDSKKSGRGYNGAPKGYKYKTTLVHPKTLPLLFGNPRSKTTFSL